MKPRQLVGTLLLGISVVACTTAPLRSDHAQLQTAITEAFPGTRLPTVGEAYPDGSSTIEPLGVDRAVQIAMLNNPQVRASLSGLDAAQAERVQAGLLRNPMLSLMVLRPNSGGRVELDYGLMQSLFDLFTRSRRIAVADAVQAGREADALLQLLTLAQDTRVAYFEAIAAGEELRIQRELLGVDEQSQRLASRQSSQGVLAASGLFESKAALSMRAHDVSQAEATLAKARSELARLLGLASASSLVLPALLPDFDVPGLDEPALQALAMRYRPELRGAQAQIAQAAAERRLQTGALRATEPSAGPAGMRDTGGMAFAGVAAQITLPLLDTGRARQQLADAQMAQAQARAESVRRQVPLEVERALAGLVSADAAVGHADHHLHQQQQLETLAKRNYQQGAGDFSSYQQAKRAHLSSLQDRLRARQMRWAAVVDLERATGLAQARWLKRDR